VETPAHVWLECLDGELVEMRKRLVEQLHLEYTGGERAELHNLVNNPTAQLTYILGHRSTVAVVAEFAYDVQQYLAGFDN
jgi:hypothetical protein